MLSAGSPGSQQVGQTPLVKAHNDLLTRVRVDHRGGRRAGSQRLQFANPFGLPPNVTILKGDAVLRKPRFLRTTGASSGLTIDDHGCHFAASRINCATGPGESL